MRTFDFYCPSCTKYFEMQIDSGADLQGQVCPKCGIAVTQVWLSAPRMTVALVPKRQQGVYDPRYVDQPEDRDGRKEQLWYLDQWRRTGTGQLSDGEYGYLKKMLKDEIEKEPKPPGGRISVVDR